MLTTNPRRLSPSIELQVNTKPHKSPTSLKKSIPNPSTFVNLYIFNLYGLLYPILCLYHTSSVCRNANNYKIISNV